MEQLPGQMMIAAAAEIIADAQDERYVAFEDKFKGKKTTDDCYTPQLVMDAVSSWVATEYHVEPAHFVRPFWPGEDFRRESRRRESRRRESRRRESRRKRWELSERELRIVEELSTR